jgi:hypothetical protein
LYKSNKVANVSCWSVITEGGQYLRPEGGQASPAKSGQFKSANGGQYVRFFQYYLDEYTKTLSEISEIRNDKKNIYKIYYGAHLKDGVEGEVRYGGKEGNRNIIEIHFASKNKNPLINIGNFAHELKHISQYIKGDLGFILFKGKQISSMDTQESETEAGRRGELFSGNTMIGNQKFEKDFRPENFRLDDHYSKNPHESEVNQYLTIYLKLGYDLLYNKQKYEIFHSPIYNSHP